MKDTTNRLIRTLALVPLAVCLLVFVSAVPMKAAHAQTLGAEPQVNVFSVGYIYDNLNSDDPGNQAMAAYVTRVAVATAINARALMDCFGLTGIVDEKGYDCYSIRYDTIVDMMGDYDSAAAFFYWATSVEMDRSEPLTVAAVYFVNRMVMFNEEREST